MKPRKDIAASVRQRLLDRARAQNRPFAELLQYYAMERFLYRLSKSRYQDMFILKGALMLRIWKSPETRPTMDIDFLGRTGNKADDIVKDIQDILKIDVEPDGLIFDNKSITTEVIDDDAAYKGIRVRFKGELAGAIINMQLDFGFDDIIYPEAAYLEFPVILDFPAPSVKCYSKESTIAEKFEAIVKLGEINSRMKDFYDVWVLLRSFEFDGPRLARAVRLTFENRRTQLHAGTMVFSDAFADLKQIQWSAFLSRINRDRLPESFSSIMTDIKQFLLPIIGMIAEESAQPLTWPPGGPWS